MYIGRPTNHTKPAVWLDGGNHAREWPAFHVAVFFIEEVGEPDSAIGQARTFHLDQWRSVAYLAP
ncbi:hypothetical protein ANCCAN_06633 [Ancylostoma caninum]|uniref:Peptidase M14 domain-containing protein n=1 Tax=Ancylostoma caninum TaxID=29170 RepID=A0A368GWF3_ANCCA|nr:hypothetical protein ANCCAN_06633 [Ancylostoma caninum]